jgi:diguanylate cyclase (GGDEF)-like protein
MGNELLRDVGKRLAGLLRKSDTIARLGGDEFAILLPKVSGRDWAERIAERCLAVLVEPFEIDDVSLEVGARIGIALYPDHASEASRLMQCADIAMYLAKQKPDNIALYDAE